MTPAEALDRLLLSQPLTRPEIMLACWHDALSDWHLRSLTVGTESFEAMVARNADGSSEDTLRSVIVAYGAHQPHPSLRDSDRLAPLVAAAYLSWLRAVTGVTA